MIYEPKNYDYREELLKPSSNFISFYWGGWHSEKYFKDIKAKDVAGIVENALAVWFSEERDNV